MNNSKDKLTEELANVLNETAEAHYIAFAAFGRRGSRMADLVC